MQILYTNGRMIVAAHGEQPATGIEGLFLMEATMLLLFPDLVQTLLLPTIVLPP